MKAKSLPEELLLASFAHLPPLDVDCSLRFVSRAYHALVERHGATYLPRYTVTIRSSGFPPFGGGQRTSECIGCFSIDGGHHWAGVDSVELKALLESGRLGRISQITIEENSSTAVNHAFANVFCEQGRRSVPVERLKLHYHDYTSHRRVVEMLRPITLELHREAQLQLFEPLSPYQYNFPFSFPSETAHLIQHYPPHVDSPSIVPSIFAKSYRDKRLVCHLSRAIDVLWWRTFPQRLIQHFHSGIYFGAKLCFPLDLLLFCDDDEKSAEYPTDGDLNESWMEMLGQPNFVRQSVGRLAVDFPHYNYYRQLEECEWSVWLMTNSRGKHLRVMQKIGGNVGVHLAVYVKMFDENDLKHEAITV